MTVLHSGTTKTYSDNWSKAFSAQARAGKPAASKKKSTAKKSAKKK